MLSAWRVEDPGAKTDGGGLIGYLFVFWVVRCIGMFGLVGSVVVV
jgi:hypothetical protein